YDPGDEFKSPPTWKGNYKFQVAALAVFPGGIEPNDEQRSLAVYVHLLESRGSNAMDSLTLKIKLLNHKDPAKTITWTSVHAFDEMDQSWGCSTLIPLEDIKKGGLGWLNGKGKIVEVTTCHWSSTNITDFDRLRVYFKIYNKTGSSGSFPFGENIRMEVHLVNHKDPTKSIVRTITRRIYPGLSCGWHSFAYQANFTAEEGWLDDEKKLVFRARTLVLEEDPTPLKPEWHEVRFDGRQEYDP
ncbi:hypothetical protein FOZ62_031139, partial [Perkinsus olseni]